MVEERVVLVAGGTGGVGPTVLSRLLADGWQVTATYRDEATRGPEQDGLRFVRCDVTDEQEVRDLATGLPVLHAVVDLVGGFASGPRVHETAPADFEAMLRLNLRPAFLLAHATVPLLLASRGAFVAVSARATQKPFAGAAGYLSAKAAVTAFVQALDADYGDQGLRANVLLPGTLDTAANRDAMPKANRTSWVTPEQFADAVALLLSPASSAIRGAAIALAGAA